MNIIVALCSVFIGWGLTFDVLQSGTGIKAV